MAGSYEVIFVFWSTYLLPLISFYYLIIPPFSEIIHFLKTAVRLEDPKLLRFKITVLGQDIWNIDDEGKMGL